MGVIKRKLQNRAGASMLIAMVFLLFSMLVGGSVLAAASVNGGRMKDQRTDQQTMLDQRSAMLVLAEMLKSENGDPLQLTVTITETTAAASEEPETPETSEDAEEPSEGGSSSGAATTSLVISIRDADINKTVMERLLYELAADIWVDKYSQAPYSASFQYENFCFLSSSGAEVNFTGLSDNKGVITFTPPSDAGAESTPLIVSYEMPTDTHNLILSFQEMVTEGEETAAKDVSVLHLEMEATVTEGTPMVVPGENGSEVTTQIITITWAQPQLVKGGVSG